MKTFKLVVFCVLTISILACDKDDSDETNNLSVEKYIEQLKTGTYESLELPSFTSKDIPALLVYSNETQMIADFPVNRISSSYLSECSLGIYVLWTIESIRTVAIDSEYLIGRFPSLNPIIQKKEEPFGVESSKEIHEIVAKAYSDWWEENKNMDFDQFKNIDPLAKTDYRWH